MTIDKQAEIVYIVSMNSKSKKINVRREKALKLYKEGMSPSDIAKQVGVSRQRVFQYINGNPKYNAEKRHQRYVYWLHEELYNIQEDKETQDNPSKIRLQTILDKIDRSEVMSLKRKGLSYAAIGRIMGISSNSVLKIVFKSGFVEPKGSVCEMCGASGKKLSRHHETYTGNDDKLVLLCSKCHRSKHKGRNDKADSYIELCICLGMYLMGHSTWKDTRINLKDNGEVRKVILKNAQRLIDDIQNKVKK